MSPEELEVMTAVYDLGNHQPQVVPYDEIADRLGITITAVKSVVGLLRNRGLVLATFGGVQLSGDAIELVGNS